MVTVRLDHHGKSMEDSPFRFRKPACLERNCLVPPTMCFQSRIIDKGLLPSLGLLLNSIFDQKVLLSNHCHTRRPDSEIYP